MLRLKQISVVLLCFLLVPFAYAATCPLQWSPGAVLGGNVKIYNQDAPIGAVIEAYAAEGGHDFNPSTPDGKTMVYTAGEYWPLTISACFFDEEITFKVNGLNASQVYYYFPGEIKSDFDLSVDCEDKDNDGYSPNGGGCGLVDCDDKNYDVNPGATETCNNVDDDCDTLIDEGLTQACGSGDCEGIQTCSEGIWSECSTRNSDCGTCCKCEDNDDPAESYDATQDNDCGLCEECFVLGACANQADGSDVKEECPEDDCKYGYCDGNGACKMKPDTTDCGVCALCDGQGNCDVYDETQDNDCEATECIDSCVLDQNPFTWDYADDVPNECVAIFECSDYECSYEHECSFDQCGAECDDTHACEDTDCDYMDDCYGDDYYDYDDVANSCLDDCTCTENQCGEPAISYNDPKCTECQTDNDCNGLDKDFCDGKLKKHTEGRCVDYECTEEDTLIEDCSLRDGIMNDCGLMEWSCLDDGNDANCTVTNVSPQDNLCSDYCDSNIRKYGGSCNPLTYNCDYLTEDCDDGNGCTEDICNEDLVECENPNSPQGKECGQARNCPDDQCNGYFAKFYPDDGHDKCDGQGNCVQYSCAMEGKHCTDYDPDDGVNTLECGAICDQNEDCEATECDGLDGCVGYDYYDYEDVDNDCLEDCTCEQNECEELIIYQNDPRCFDELNISLKEEWNLISIPLVSDDMTAGNIFKDIDYTKIFAYIDGRWYELDDDSLIDSKKGYWISSLSEQTLVLEGMETGDIVFDLDEGWNLIGYPSLDEVLVSEILEGIEYSVVYSYDGWSSYVPGRPFNSLTVMKPGYGYWVNVE